MKKLIIGIFIGVALTISGQVLAEDSLKTVFAKFNISINGDLQEINALVHNNVTHLPTRQLANMLGKHVTYDDSSRTIIITETQNEVQTSMNQNQDVTERIVTLQKMIEEHQFWAEFHQKMYDGFKAMPGWEGSEESERKKVEYQRDMIEKKTQELNELLAQQSTP